MSKPQEAPKILMPQATAIWLVENTVLTFEQVAEFTGIHKVEVQALADEDVGRGIVGRDPVKYGETTKEELEKATADDSYFMNDKPDAIAWILKHHPEISDAQIGKLVGTTKPTIQAIRDRTHQSSSSLRPRNPADLGLCTYQELEAASNKGYKAQGKDPEEMKAKRLAEQEAANAPLQSEEETAQSKGGFDFSNFLSSGIGGAGGNSDSN